MPAQSDQADGNQPDYIRAHCHSIRHWSEIQESTSCGCFYCLSIFAPTDIADWVDDVTNTGVNETGGEGHTAFCPECGIDSVIGSASRYPIIKEFLAQMNDHWFSTKKD
jgi:hypothetical protein